MTTTTTVLIAEYGARWDEWATHWCGPGRQLIVLVQHARESIQDFRGRVDSSLDRLERSGVLLRRVVWVPTEDLGEDSLVSLAQIQTVQGVANRLEESSGAQPRMLRLSRR